MAVQGRDGKPKRNCHFLLDLVEGYKLFHVKTLHYSDLKGILCIISESTDGFVPGTNVDTLAELQRYIRECHHIDIQPLAIHDEVHIYSQTKYLLVYIKDRPDRPSAVVVFLMANAKLTTAPYSKDVSDLVDGTKRQIEQKVSLDEFLPAFSARPRQEIHPLEQCDHPVLDVHQPQHYNARAKHRPSSGSVDSFNRQYIELPTEQPLVNPWSVYSGIPDNLQCSVDLEKLIQDPRKTLGRGGFGITVQTSSVHVAKVNMFPEMADWSMPFIDDPFYRYAHIATQVEEIMIGVSMKHPNILRTFGGYWCDIPRYALGGRAVIVMEKALFSLHEFMCRMNRDQKLNAPSATRHTALIPIVELDTLKGLEYLHSRKMQHRDLTYKNILVCHQPERVPVPFAFKISDFGTSSNYSTPDQQRGNRVHMAPEVLWCLNSTTASDVFSWYCVMWELYTGLPLIEYRASSQSPEFCKKTYAYSLSRLVGVYTPSDPNTAFANNYMKSYDCETVYNKYKNSRPDGTTIAAKLGRLGSTITDKTFVAMGTLCITLFPQERCMPSQLLKLNRYTSLGIDVSAAATPTHVIPSSMRVGQYKATDVIVANDCIYQDLRKLSREGKLQVFTHESKRYYGIDVFRLSPDLQPVEWYTMKEEALRKCFESTYAAVKRKADNPLKSLMEDLGPTASNGLATGVLCTKKAQIEPRPGPSRYVTVDRSALDAA